MTPRFVSMFALPVLLIACATHAPSVERHYHCTSGSSIMASYPDADTVRILYRGKSHDLKRTISASGARYAGDGLEWWTKEPDGTLFVHNDDGSTGQRLEGCSTR